MVPDPLILNPQSSIRNRETRLTRLISLWFALQVTFNIAIALYLALHPPDEPVTWLERLDFTVNTGVNAALATGLWQRRSWAWTTAVVLVPLYWTLHAWHMVVPEEGLLLWPFLMVDAVILGYLLSSRGRQALHAPWDRWLQLSFLPAPMFALGLYALLAPIMGLFIAASAAMAVVVVGWRRALPPKVGRGDTVTRGCDSTKHAI